MEGNLCSGMGRGCRGRFYFLGRGARGAKKRVVWKVGLSSLSKVCGLHYYVHLLDVSWSELLSVYSERER